MAVGGVEADLAWQTMATGDMSQRGGRDGHRSGPDKVDARVNEARGRDARILVRNCG